MARADHKKLLREKNQVAQLPILKADLAEVTTALSDNSKENSRLIKANEALRAENAVLTEEGQRISEENKAKISTAQTALDKIEKQLNAKLEEVKLAEEHLDDSTLTFNELIISGNAIFEKNGQAIFKQNNEIESLNYIRENLVKEIDSLNLTANEIYGKISTYEVEFNSNKAKGEIELTDLEVAIKASKKELKLITAQVEEEKVKILIPRETLKQEEIMMERKRRDLDLYEARVKQRFAIVFPDKQIKLV